METFLKINYSGMKTDSELVKRNMPNEIVKPVNIISNDLMLNRL